MKAHNKEEYDETEFRHLITTEELQTLTRPMSAHIDSGRMQVCIEEAERLDIIPSLTDTFYLEISRHHKHRDYTILLEGGTFEDACGRKHNIAGLKRAVAYYAFARLIRLAGTELTRYGIVSKTDEYSEDISHKEKVAAYQDARLVGDGYLKECIDYMNLMADDFPIWKTTHRVQKYGRAKFKIIGE